MILPILMRKKRKPNKYQRLINKFIKEPSAIYKNRGFIAREVAIAKKIYALVEDEKFWKECHLPFKLNSLAWILSQDGVDWINTEVLRLKTNLPKPVVYDLENEKFGNDKKIEKKKTLLDFLRDA